MIIIQLQSAFIAIPSLLLYSFFICAGPDRNIAAIFKGWNIVEYKSPEDSLTIADFHQVMAYAHLYCTPPGKGT